MSDHDSPLPDDHDGAGDPLIARLRSGLDALADRVDDTPPALSDMSAVPAMARPGAPRWMLGAAAAAVVAIGVGAVLVNRGEDDPLMDSTPTSVDASTAIATAPPVTGGSTPVNAPQLYRAVATVLEDDGRGPQLCLGPILTSYPPQCGGPDITNWSWDEVPHEPRQLLDPSLEITAKWGEYVVVGTYDAEARSFTLTEPARVAEPRDYQRTPEPDFSTPCEAPPGGWPLATEEELTNAASQVQAANQSDDGSVITDPATGGDGFISRFAGLWLGRDPFVLNIAIAARPDEMTANGVEAAIRQFYDGPLCLVPVTRSLAELTSIQDSIGERDVPELSTIGVEVTTNQVVVELTAPNAELAAGLNAEFGNAVVVRVTDLVPIDGTGEPSPPATAPPTTPPDTVTAEPPPSTLPPLDTTQPPTDPTQTDPTPALPPPTDLPPPTASPPTEPPGTVDPDTPVTSPDPVSLTYRFVGTVAQTGDEDAQMCPETGDDHFPFDCDLPIANWTWDSLDPTVRDDLRFGEYVVIGTFDPAANELTITSPARVATDDDDDPAPDPDTASPCDEPEPGAPSFDPANTNYLPVQSVAGYGGMWVSDADGYTLNVRIVGDLDAARTQIRERYAGPLCLVPSELTYAELDEIRAELLDSRFADIITVIHTDAVTGDVTIEAVWPDPKLFQFLERQYPGTVTVTDSVLELVD